jgi:hypothetical protein
MEPWLVALLVCVLAAGDVLALVVLFRALRRRSREAPRRRRER